MTCDVLVVGGGIGGLALALGAAHAGKRVTVLERAAAFGEIGAGIQLAPNASRALDRLGVLPAVQRNAVFPQRLIWNDAATGERLTTLELGAAFRERYGYPYLVLHRSDLLGALLAACEADARVALVPNADVVAVEDRASSAVARTRAGDAHAAALLVGADGLWSTIRSAVVGDGDPVCSAYVAYRGAIPFADVQGDAALDEVVLWTGHERHLVQYPVRRGELYNQVAVFRSPRFDAGETDWGTPEELDARYAGDAAPVRRGIAKVLRNRRWPMYDRLPVTGWTRGRITLLGDAAHPMLQYLAQGAAQALEDAVALASALAAFDDVDAAVAAYERERVGRTARVQTLARAWGDWWHLAEHGARDARLRARAGDDYTDVDWFYG